MISGCPIAFACFQRRVIHRRATVRVLSFDQVNLFEYFLSRNSLVKVGKSDKKVKREKYKRENIGPWWLHYFDMLCNCSWLNLRPHLLPGQCDFASLAPLGRAAKVRIFRLLLFPCILLFFYRSLCASASVPHLPPSPSKPWWSHIRERTL